MSVKFTIKNSKPEATKEADGSIIRYSGVAEPFRQASERKARVLEVDINRNPIKWEFVTGLDEEKVDFMPWYSSQEKELIKQTIVNLKKDVIEKFYGKAPLDASNYAFWKMEPGVNRIFINNRTSDIFYDTSKAEHALLYLSIIAGAFIDTVAPTEKWARDNRIDHYLALESEEVAYNKENLSRSDAHAALADLRKNGDPEALFILAWCLQFDTRSFGAYTKATPFNQLVDYHIQYIDGKLNMKRKRDTPKVFLDYYERWKGQQTRPLLYAEAYVKAGDWFGFIPRRDKKLTTPEGAVLGITHDEAVRKITKPTMIDEFERLKTQVEEKWKQ